jgi:predicted SAM-dependent methyltransferase
LNSDYSPASKAVVFLDATRAFPIPDGAFDYVYSEHMIEHVSWEQGAHMLRECARILKRGGKIRLVTPDLRAILSLYSQDNDLIQQRYIQWATDRFIPWAPCPKASFVVNNLFRDWGHQFLYDAELLTMAMREAGFEDIKHHGYGESDDNELKGIERHGSNAGSEELVAFESLILEGRRG